MMHFIVVDLDARFKFYVLRCLNDLMASVNAEDVWLRFLAACDCKTLVVYYVFNVFFFFF